LGIKMNDPRFIEIHNDQDFIRTVGNLNSQETTLVVVVLPNSQVDRYSRIKKELVTRTPIPSQCILNNTITKTKMLKSVCTKVVQQMSAKIGAQLWTVNIPLKATLIVGIDICHDSQAHCSILGFVSTLNSEASNYYSQVQRVDANQEISTKLRTCMVNSLRQFQTVVGQLPERVFVYRDGVGESQTRSVLEGEIPQLEGAFQETYAEKPQPRFTFVIVRKRVNSRFFEPQQHSHLINPEPGTLIDSVVVHRNEYDFFLISQVARQGSVTPTYYHVVKDTSGLPALRLQLLTFKLCHLFYNWPGTIAVPAPCQYAHRIAFFVAKYIHHNPSAALSKLLYYL